MVVDPRIGTELAGYRIEEFLGRGGMSVVYRAQHLGLERRAALKLMSPELAVNPNFRERFIRESRVAAGIDHPNIIPIYEAGEADDLLYIAMRFVEGTDLKKLLAAEGPLELERAFSVISQVANALDSAHQHGLVHRDVKPGNILMVPHGPEGADHVYLSDFGLTRRVDSLSDITAIGQLVGTIQYMAPEQIEGKTVDHRGDIYSLGCVLFETLTGSIPYDRDTEVAIMWAHVQEPPPSATALRRDLPSGVDEVIERALTKLPEKRFESCGDLCRALGSALGIEVRRTSWPSGSKDMPTLDVAETEPPEDISPEASPGTKRSRWPIVTAIAVVAVLTTVVLATRQSDRDEGSGTAAIDPNTVVVLDDDGAGIAEAFEVDADPLQVAIDGGAVWVTSGVDRTVSRVDPDSGEIDDTFPTGGDPTSLDVAGDDIWVGHRSEGSVTHIDTGSGESSTIGLSVGVSAVAITGDAVWVTNELTRSVSLIDPGSEKVVAEIALEGEPEGIAVGTGAVWVITNSPNAVVRLSPSSGEVEDVIGLLNSPTAISVDTQVWLASRASDLILRVDPATNTVTDRVEVGNEPSALAVDGDRVWVVNQADATLSHIDSDSSSVVDTLDLNHLPTAVAAGPPGVWVSISRR